MLPEGMPEDHINYLNYYKNKDKDSSVTPEKNHFTNKQKIIAAVSGIALTAAMVAGGVAFNKYSHRNQVVETEAPTTTTGTTQMNVEVNPTNEELPKMEDLEITNLSLMNNPEELAKMFDEDRLTEWFNAGATPENAKAAFASRDIPAYAKKIAEQYDPIFISALFVNNWESNPSLVEMAKRMKEGHLSTLTAYYATSLSDIDPANKEPYRRGIEVTKIDSMTSSHASSINSRTITITTTQHDYDNANNNMIGTEKQYNGGVTGQENKPTTTYTIEGNTIKLSNVVFSLN